MIDIKHISKSLGEFNLKIDNLRIESGSYVVILGDSGSGKSLFLEILSGLIKPDKGCVLIDNQDVLGFPVNKRPFGLVFQDQSLFPHMTAKRNISYPLKKGLKNSRKIEAKVNSIAKKLEASHLLDRSPNTLSGGEKQRISLARTLITEPLCLLLDEPLSALDVNLKKEIRSLLRWLNRTGQTILHVTHDYDEAISLASHIGVMSKGELIQFGTTEQVLNKPRSPFVANFTGISNYFKVSLRVTESGDHEAITESGIPILISTQKTHGNGYVIVPSESILLSHKSITTSAANQFEGKISEISVARYGVEIKVNAAIPLVVRVTRSAIDKMKLAEGQSIWLSFKASSVQYINK